MQTAPQVNNLLVLQIEGMDCAEEVAILRQELEPIVGSDALAFDLLNQTLSIRLKKGITQDVILAAIHRTGLQGQLKTTQQSLNSERVSVRTITTVLSGAFLVCGWIWQATLVGLHGELVVGHQSFATIASIRGLYFAAILLAGWSIVPRAWYALLRMRPDMNLLMLIAVIGAIGLGDWLEAATVTVLFAISLVLESWSVWRARRAIEALMDLAPAIVHVKGDLGEIELPPEQVEVGALFLVKPGERIPLDGIVLEGMSGVNQAPITGESVPVTKSINDTVYAGTINGDGHLTVKSSQPASNTTLAGIIRLVNAAQSRRSPSEQWVDRFARIYTPVVFVSALLVMFGLPLVLGGTWSEWIYRGLVLLVIACPCALVISTPVSIVSSLAAAARQGVLIKGGEVLEAPGELIAIALDKTGTLTMGKLHVQAVVTFNGHSEQEVLERAAALEIQSTHPLARAIVNYAEDRGVSVTRAADFQTIQGKGAEGTWNGRKFWLGSRRLLLERQQESAQVIESLDAMSAKGHSIVLVGNDQHVCGLIALSDSIRPEIRNTLEKLRSTGIQRVIMLTGDHELTAKAIAEETGVDEFHSLLLPSDKVRIIKEIRQRYGKVAMVGDGVNDAPAMAEASLGIAMGAIGSDVAIETADIALMADDLNQLPWLIRHSRRTVSIIQQNIWFSLGVKILFGLLTLSGMASMWGAIAADTGASLIVVSNGLRLLRPGH